MDCLFKLHSLTKVSAGGLCSKQAVGGASVGWVFFR